MSVQSTPPRKLSRRWVRRTALGAAAVVVAAIAAPFIYIHFIEAKAPPKLALQPAGATNSTTPGQSPSASSGSASDASVVTGPYHVAAESLVGYRVDEILIGQKTTAVGRTSKVTGQFTIAGTSVPKASFTVAMASVVSDQSGRNAQFRGRLLDTLRYPTATFSLTRPIALGAIPATGKVISADATGSLTLRGETKPVTFGVHAERTSTGIEVQGEIPILFSTWGIPNPSFGPIQTQDHGVLEFLFHLAKGAPSGGALNLSQPSGGGGGFGQIKVPSTTVPPLGITSAG